MLENFKNWKTTLLGIGVALVSILVAMGVIDPSDQEAVNNTLSTILMGAGAVVAGVTSLWLMFKSKDKDTPKE